MGTVYDGVFIGPEGAGMYVEVDGVDFKCWEETSFTDPKSHLAEKRSSWVRIPSILLTKLRQSWKSKLEPWLHTCQLENLPYKPIQSQFRRTLAHFPNPWSIEPWGNAASAVPDPSK